MSHTRRLSSTFPIPALLFTLLLIPVSIRCETVTLPIHLDYEMLRSLVVYRAFTEPGQTAVLKPAADPCLRIIISEPAFRPAGNLLQFETRLHVEVGAELAGKCRVAMTWDGYLELYQRPHINTEWVLSFETVHSELLNIQRGTTILPEMIWELISRHVYAYLEKIRINLSPPVLDAKSVLLALFPDEHQVEAKRLFDSMRPGNIRITEPSVTVEILANADTSPESGSTPEKDLTSEELESFAKAWESYDAFLVYIIQSLVHQDLTDGERDILFHTLIETRYEFVQALSEKRSSGKDFVREQFIAAWNQLSPVFRNHLGKEPSQALLAYIAFFSASDALSALDKIGPRLGIEISRDGLIRLARLLSGRKTIELSYSSDINTDLRTVLGMGEPIPIIGPVYDREELPVPEEAPLDRTGDPPIRLDISRLHRFLTPSTAWAADEVSATELSQIRQWIADPKNLDAFVQQVQALLVEVTGVNLKKSRIPASYRDLFRQIVLASAWQESCFRQYLLNKGKITYLRSYNNTSVGLMQVNERVWRSLYDVKALRWDIRYNALAGCEILDQYFTRYSLPKSGKDVDPNTLAGSLYAMYNSGPGDFSKYQNRRKTGKLLLTDTLFQEKFTWVQKNQWDAISKCLGGG